jgi:hypothetical protein
MIAVSTAGKAWVKSAVRMISMVEDAVAPDRSREQPERRCRRSGRCPTAPSPTASELRAPTMIMEKTSRPNWSVPNQCSADGRPCSRFRIAIWVGW